MIPQLTLGCSVTAAKSSSDDDSVNVVVFGEVYEEVNANSSRIAQLVFRKCVYQSQEEFFVKSTLALSRFAFCLILGLTIT